MKKAKYLTLALALAVALSACGGGGGGKDSGFINQPDKPFTDPLIYGSGPDDSVKDASEGEAISYNSVVINNTKIDYTATTGHLVTVDSNSSIPNAKMFYVAFTANNKAAETRPVTFLYNGGPGSAAVWLLMGSFAPKRIKTSMPDFTPPAPYTLEANPDSLLDKTDLVFINPVGTGYSAAISPSKNKDFWGVDQDAKSITGFIRRYLSKNGRWNSPKYLMGESYGTPRSAVTSFYLHQEGIDLNGITLVSSILDFSKNGSLEGLLPTLAANAWYHHKNIGFAEQTLPQYLDRFQSFSKSISDTYSAIENWIYIANQFIYTFYYNSNEDIASRISTLLKSYGTYEEIITALSGGTTAEINESSTLESLLASVKIPVAIPDETATQLGNYTGLDASDFRKITDWSDRLQQLSSYAAARLLAAEGKQIGLYDGRATGIYAGIVQDVNYLDSDPSLVNVQSAYTSAWNFYLNGELKYNSTSDFKALNLAIQPGWDYSHVDPAKRNKGGSGSLYTAGDLAATMTLNPDLKVFQASGYYDSVTPFNQTNLDLAGMDLKPEIRKNIDIKVYPSGHMIYLDGESRTKMKNDLSAFYDATTHNPMSMQRILKLQKATLNSKIQVH